MGSIRKVALPLSNALCKDNTKDEYLSELRRAGASRVWLCPGLPYRSETQLNEEEILLKKNIEFFKAAGLEVGIWMGGLGHGTNYTPEGTEGFTRIRDLASGAESPDSICPLDPAFEKCYLAFIRRMALCQPDLLQIDDDYRLACHGKVSLGCACDRHMAEFSRRFSREVSREELANEVFCGQPNRFREVWLELAGDTLKGFAQKVRNTVDEVNPGLRVSACACIPTYDTEGYDSFELSRIFAGKTKPYLRFIGAPYWHRHGFELRYLGNIIEIERMQEHWAKKHAPEVEICYEGDVFPRPRYNVPAAYLEGMDAALVASGGFDYGLKYMLDYGNLPKYETGYIDRHEKNVPYIHAVHRLFDGKNTVGVRICESMQTLKKAQFDGNAIGNVGRRLFARSLSLASGCSLPVTYDRCGGAEIVFGESARNFDEPFDGVPLVLDVASARILTEKGVDVGFVSAQKCKATFEVCAKSGDRVPLSGKGYYRLEISPQAEILSTYDDENGSPASYYYENDAGGKFLVLAIDAAAAVCEDAFFCSYLKQHLMISTIERMQGYPLPAVIEKCPGAYVLTKEKDGVMAVGVWNFYADEILDPIIKLWKDYHKVRFIHGSGQLFGNVVKLDKDIPAFGSVVFEVR